MTIFHKLLHHLLPRHRAFPCRNAPTVGPIKKFYKKIFFYTSLPLHTYQIRPCSAPKIACLINPTRKNTSPKNFRKVKKIFFSSLCQNIRAQLSYPSFKQKNFFHFPKIFTSPDLKKIFSDPPQNHLKMFAIINRLHPISHFMLANNRDTILTICSQVPHLLLKSLSKNL